ncbi:MAG: UDP-glucose 4-epimerase GalE, partial [Bacteroidota bacterium]|nr:UDP-glucose 4-epimerase GalE [Bacteroidota bacterium]
MVNRRRILVTGGAGYIGSHTIIELLQDPLMDVVSIDNFSNSSPSTYERIKSITGRSIETHDIDLCDLPALKQMISNEGPINGVIHFAAFKSVPESVQWPLKYYHNNLDALLNILEVIKENDIPTFIFSSSCSVYGDIEKLPVSETTTLGEARSPYAYTKQVGERIVNDHTVAHNGLGAISLRYFNPVGAHPSGRLGEDPINPPTSLVPIITRAATGRIKELTVHGIDYDTRDGSCIRDYVHVCDIARAHVKALDHAGSGGMSSAHEIINLGTGKGI